MYTTCDCVKRNGLQDKCPRSMCQGRSACMCFPTPNCCPAAFPLRYANVTMGVNNKRSRCRDSAALCVGGCCPSPCCPSPCCPTSCCPSPCCDSPCCGPSSPPCGAPSPITCPMPNCCPPIAEAGIPDPRVWNCCTTPPQYPCKSRYLKRKDGPCIWPCPCKAHCYKTPPKPCC